jgi:hypothetical protein
MYVRVFTMATAAAIAMAILVVVETTGWRSKWSFAIYRYFYGHLDYGQSLQPLSLFGSGTKQIAKSEARSHYCTKTYLCTVSLLKFSKDILSTPKQ